MNWELPSILQVGTPEVFQLRNLRKLISTKVEDVTSYPLFLGGRVKTLHLRYR